jgi:hypothetical protein
MTASEPEYEQCDRCGEQFPLRSVVHAALAFHDSFEAYTACTLDHLAELISVRAVDEERRHGHEHALVDDGDLEPLSWDDIPALTAQRIQEALEHPGTFVPRQRPQR